MKTGDLVCVTVVLVAFFALLAFVLFSDAQNQGVSQKTQGSKEPEETADNTENNRDIPGTDLSELEKNIGILKELEAAELKMKNVASARMKDLLAIYGLQEIDGSQIVKRVFQYDNRKYLAGWISYAADGSVKERSVFKYNNQSYLVEWLSSDVADNPVRKIVFQYDASGYLTELETTAYERGQ